MMFEYAYDTDNALVLINWRSSNSECPCRRLYSLDFRYFHAPIERTDLVCLADGFEEHSENRRDLVDMSESVNSLYYNFSGLTLTVMAISTFLGRLPGLPYVSTLKVPFVN